MFVLTKVDLNDIPENLRADVADMQQSYFPNFFLLMQI